MLFIGRARQLVGQEIVTHFVLGGELNDKSGVAVTRKERPLLPLV